MISRTLDLTAQKHSFFLFGPRQVGKTFLIKHTLKPDLFLNLLSHQEYMRYAKDPSILSQEAKSLRKGDAQVVIDEIQRAPELLNEVQLIMSDVPGMQFIMTGSSARKLRRAGVNLLGGRAITVHLYPLTHEELGAEFLLEEALRFGTLPHIFLEKDIVEKGKLLKSYVETYLKEEIQQEALTRNIPAFARFLELAAFENGNILNFQRLASEVGVHAKTIKEYFQILEDTLLGFMVEPYHKSHRTRIVSHPKFYFFDTGVISALRGELASELIEGSPPYGKAFECWAINEIRRMLDYRNHDAKMSFFRTTDGAEVDVILERSDGDWAVEIKSAREPGPREVKGLRSFMSDHDIKRAICVCRTPRPFTRQGIEFLPWEAFLSKL
jgi:predicted AAA+ superfamily ATPase